MLNQKPITDPGTQRTGDLPDSVVATKEFSPSKITVEDTLMGTDPPIEEAHPGLQPALVFGTYPIVLIVLIAIAGGYFAFFRSNTSSNETRPVQSEVAK